MFKNTSRACFFLLVTLLFSGCTTLYNPATGKNEFIIVDTDTEKSLGKNVVADFRSKSKLDPDNKSQERIAQIGRRVAAVSERKDIDYSFQVLADKELNALTLPGGYVFINRGLVDKLNDDEIAYVLAHEVGHTAARHIAKKLQANMAYQLLAVVAFSSIGRSNAGVAADVARGTNQVYELVSLSYSRQDEFEADRLGVKYSSLAGFSPYASLMALEKIKNNEGPRWKLLQYFRTHPYVQDRIIALEEYIPKLKK
ncbi:MAG: M48 family metalloprotease [Candidatus Omnitrophica bacterium]|nr:M48 family metalloprotease [Candidatus Omnitrophota bacterium]